MPARKKQDERGQREGGVWVELDNLSNQKSRLGGHRPSSEHTLCPSPPTRPVYAPRKLPIISRFSAALDPDVD